MREQYLAAVRARLERVTSTQDLSTVLHPGVPGDVQRLSGLLRDGDGDTEARLALGWMHYYRYLALPEGPDRDELRSAVTLLLDCFVLGVEPLPEQLLPILADLATAFGDQVLRHAIASPDPDAASAAVELWQRITLAASDDDPEWETYSSNLGLALRIRYDLTGRPEDLDLAVDIFRHAADNVPADHPHRPEHLNRLGRALLDRSAAAEDVHGAVTAGREAVRLAPPDHPNRHAYLGNLGNAWRARYGLTQAPGDLDAAIDAIRQAVDAAPALGPDRAGYLSLLGAFLATRYERFLRRTDIDAAAEALRESAGAGPEDASRHYNLGVVLYRRFERSGERDDLDGAVDAYRRAIDLVPGRCGWLNNLGVALRVRFDRTGRTADLETALRVGREAVELEPGDPAALSNLGVTLMTSFRRTGQRADLDDAVRTADQAVAAMPPDLPGRAGVVNNLALALVTRAERTGSADDLARAVSTAQEAVAASPPEDPDRSNRLGNLMTALRLRFERAGDMEDIDAAVRAGRAAVDAVRQDSGARGELLSDLGSALQRRFERTSRMSDLDAAIDAAQGAVEATPGDHPARARYLAHLGVAWHKRFEVTRAPHDLETAIDALRQGIGATPADDPQRAGHLSNLGNALLAADRIDDAVTALREAVELTPADQPDRPGYLSNLGNALGARYRRTGGGAEEALAAYRSVVDDPLALPAMRISAARPAAELARHRRPELAAELLETAVRLVPEVTPRRLHRRDRLYHLSLFRGLADDAAALTLEAGERTGEQAAAVRALRLLEAGRAVLLGQLLETRGDLSDLERDHPTLAARFARLRGELDADHLTRDDRVRLTSEFAALVAEIRDRDGFRTFMAPPAPEDLIAEARSGPVVVFSISRYRSDALLLTGSGITCLPLPLLTADAVIQRFHTFTEALTESADPDAGWQDRVAAQDTLHEVLEWLWDAAAGPVLDALGLDGGSGADLPRVWWVTGGMLGMLPLHAAGHHRDGGPSVMDRVVSSHTPTIRALRHARRSIAPGGGRTLIVAMPETPDQDPLPNAAAEAALLHERMPDALTLIGSATRAQVLAALPECSIAHFACHGVSDLADPSDSRLLLADHDGAPFTVAGLTSVNLERAELAYLSACSTALMSVVTLGSVELDPALRAELPGLAAAVPAANQNADLVDEAIHLSSAFQLAGFRHVVSTLWEIDDVVAVRLADDFYAGLRGDAGSSARALHDAVRALRDKRPRLPSLWASYLHAGA